MLTYFKQNALIKNMNVILHKIDTKNYFLMKTVKKWGKHNITL